jgi:vacuolar protein sorting-associated protein 13A/C
MLETLMKFIDIAVPKLGDDTPTAAVEPMKRDRKRTAVIEEYNLHDHDHDHDDNQSVRSLRTVDSRDDGSDKGEKFYEAQDDTTEARQAL